MKIKMDKLSVLLMNPLLSDQQFTEEICFLKAFSIYSVFVLPVNVARTKQLLRGTSIRIGTLIDYPLANGTMSKKVFEAVQAINQGASNVLITITPHQLATFDEKHFNAFRQLSFGNNTIGFFIDIEQLGELPKKEVIMNLSARRLNYLALEMDKNQALIDMSVVSVSVKESTHIQVNLPNPILLEIELLLKSGATKVAIKNFREILTLLSDE